MPYSKRIDMSKDHAREDIEHIDQVMDAKSGNKDDAVDAIVNHIKKIDDEKGPE